jgi:pimeloyl-ACP methyl ester carboxylesterase
LNVVLIGIVVLLAVVLAGPFLVPVSELTDVAPPEALARPGGEFVSVPFPGTGGIQLYVERDASLAQRADAPVFVLLHGFAANLSTWDELRPWLRTQGDVISYDRIPFGLSARLLEGDWHAESPYTDQAAVDQLGLLLDESGVARALLIGNSAGGSLALKFALQQPERVSGLVLLSPAVYGGRGGGVLGRLADTPQMRHLGPLVSRRFAANDDLLERAYDDPARITDATRHNARISVRVENWDRAFWEYVRGARRHRVPLVEAEVEALTERTPMLIVTGDNDRIVATADTERLGRAVPAATFAVLPACGHVPQEECRDALIAVMASWLARHDG